MSESNGSAKEKGSSKVFSIINSKKVVPYVFIAPFIISFSLFTFYPAIRGIVMSFQNLLPGQITFIGLENYTRIFNATFYKALSNTTIFTIFTVLILVIIPLIFSILLDSKLVIFKKFFRSSLFIPALCSIIVSGIVFRLLFAEADNAAANQILNWIGLNSVNWRYEAWSAMFLMVILASWRWMGLNVIYFLAALQTIPKELFEAADIDGANQFQKFWYVTIPYIKPITIFVATVSVIGGFRMFEESFVYWETSSPGNIGLSVVGYLYQQGVQQNDLGFGAAVGVVLMLIIFVVSILQLYLTGGFKRGEN